MWRNGAFCVSVCACYCSAVFVVDTLWLMLLLLFGGRDVVDKSECVHKVHRGENGPPETLFLVVGFRVHIAANKLYNQYLALIKWTIDGHSGQSINENVFISRFSGHLGSYVLVWVNCTTSWTTWTICFSFSLSTLARSQMLTFVAHARVCVCLDVGCFLVSQKTHKVSIPGQFSFCVLFLFCFIVVVVGHDTMIIIIFPPPVCFDSAARNAIYSQNHIGQLCSVLRAFLNCPAIRVVCFGSKVMENRYIFIILFQWSITFLWNRHTRLDIPQNHHANEYKHHFTFHTRLVWWHFSSELNTMESKWRRKCRGRRRWKKVAERNVNTDRSSRKEARELSKMLKFEHCFCWLAAVWWRGKWKTIEYHDKCVDYTWFDVENPHSHASQNNFFL